MLGIISDVKNTRNHVESQLGKNGSYIVRYDGAVTEVKSWNEYVETILALKVENGSITPEEADEAEKQLKNKTNSNAQKQGGEKKLQYK